MAKQKKENVQVTNPEPQQSTKVEKKNPQTLGEWFLDFRFQSIVIALLGLIFYVNSFSNEYALDDRPLIIKNEFVQRGISGIGDIMTHDAFASYIKQQNSNLTLTGGRYRPLSIVTFAIEQQLLGIHGDDLKKDSVEFRSTEYMTEKEIARFASDMHFRHVVNVLLYIFSVIVLLYFLRKIVFPDNPLISFLTALIFVIHPLHTEVVANVKSRDEIMSMLFMTLTLLSAFEYRDTKQRPKLIASLVYFLLALFSKEYGATLFIIIPVSLYIFRKHSFVQSAKFVLIYLAPFVLYALMRINAVNAGAHTDMQALDDGLKDVITYPYLFATPVQHVASVVAVLFRYFQVLVLPYPLSSDYSYKQIPYADFASYQFWISIAFYGTLIWAMLKWFKARSVLAFAAAFYLINILLVGNVFFNIGAPMGERLAYHSSFGFAIAVAYLLNMLWVKLQASKMNVPVVGGLIVLLIAGSGFVTIQRNVDWKSDKVLYLHDVNVSPNSVLILSNAGSACVDHGDDAKDSVDKRMWYRKAITFFNRALEVNPKHTNAFQNRGTAYYQLGLPDSAMADWDMLRKLYPDHPSLDYLTTVLSNYYFKEGMKWGRAGDHEQAIIYFQKSAHANGSKPDAWYNLGFANFSAGHYEAAIKAFEMCLKIPKENKYLGSCNNFLAQAREKLAATGGQPVQAVQQ